MGIEYENTSGSQQLLWDLNPEDNVKFNTVQGS
jgi:hypothetical protein